MEFPKAVIDDVCDGLFLDDKPATKDTRFLGTRALHNGKVDDLAEAFGKLVEWFERGDFNEPENQEQFVEDYKQAQVIRDRWLGKGGIDAKLAAKAEPS